MSSEKIITHEIGSLAKPSWRIKAFTGAALDQKDLDEAQKWGKKLNLPEREDLLKILSKKQGFTSEEKAAIMRFSSLYATRFLESAGLDLVWDGEQHRVEMYEYAVRHMTGFAFHGHVRSFDNKYYYKASCIDEPGFEQPYHVKEYEQIAQFAKKPVKIPVTGAYTLVDWSYDEHYLSAVVPGHTTVKEMCRDARKQFLFDITKNVIYPNIQALHKAGVRYIQIDEPAGTTKRNEIPEFIEVMRQSIGDLAGKAFFSMHICFSDYQRLFPALNSLQGILDEVHFEYANRDTKELGVNSTTRKGYELLQQFKGTSFKIGLGVLDVHTDFIESPELVRDRILYAAEIVGDPTRLYVSPDCGLRTRSWDVSYAKLCNMVEGRNLAEKALSLHIK